MLMSLIYACFKEKEQKNMDDFKILSQEDMYSMESSMEDLNDTLIGVSPVKDIPRVDPISVIDSPFSCVIDNQHTMTSYDHLSLHNRKTRLKAIRDCLISLRDEHLRILSEVKQEQQNCQLDNRRNQLHSPSFISNVPFNYTSKSLGGQVEITAENFMNASSETKIENINKSVEKLDNGIEESSALLSFTDHFIKIEMERDGLRFAMMRVIEENHRMQEELSVSQRRLIEAESELGNSFQCKHYFFC